MRAVNLIPSDERRGAGGAAGRSGGAAYVLLALLAVMVAVVALVTVTKRSVADKRSEIASVTLQASAAEAKAADLSSFQQFSALRVARTQTVSSLAASRFDWAHTLGEVARVVPRNVSLTSLKGTVTPGVTVKSGGAATTSGLRSALAVPAIELGGCTVDQASVARMLTRMRLIDGVTHVSLQSSVKPDANAAGAAAVTDASSGDASGCRRGKPGKAPSFGIVVFFDQAAGSVPTTTAGAGRIAASQITPSGATGATGPATAGVTP